MKVTRLDDVPVELRVALRNVPFEKVLKDKRFTDFLDVIELIGQYYATVGSLTSKLVKSKNKLGFCGYAGCLTKTDNRLCPACRRKANNPKQKRGLTDYGRFRKAEKEYKKEQAA